MSVNINTVYQRVQSIANKEQRGYVTPLEFNRFANQAQLEIFEQYFYDLDQYLRRSGNDTRYADPVDTLEEKISLFEKFNATLSYNGSNEVFTLPTDIYKVNSLWYNNTEIEHVSNKDITNILASNLTLPTNNHPVYTKNYYGIVVYGGSTASPYYEKKNSDVKMSYIIKPAVVNWGYVLDANNDALYNSTASTNFELHASEEPNLVIKILELAGVAMKAQDIYQIADKENIEDIQQQKA
jgi:hypothetical protein